MPILDYNCTSCSYYESHFYPLADYPYPETIKCEKCQSLSERDYMAGSPSTGFLVPPVVHYNPSTGQYSIPGHRDDEVDRGYVKVEMRDMRMYGKISKAVNALEMEKAQFLQEREREYFDARLKEQRENRKVQVEQAVNRGGYWRNYEDEQGRPRREWCPVTKRALALLDASQKFTDASIAKRRARVRGNGPNFHSRMLEHNNSEQSVVDGAGKKATFFIPRGR